MVDGACKISSIKINQSINQPKHYTTEDGDWLDLNNPEIWEKKLSDVENSILKMQLDLDLDLDLYTLKGNFDKKTMSIGIIFYHCFKHKK